MKFELLKNRKTIIISVLVFIGLGILANVGITKILTRYREIKKVDHQINLQKAANERLKKEIHLAKTDISYIERLARKELGLIQPGEIEYRFIEKDKKGK